MFLAGKRAAEATRGDNWLAYANGRIFLCPDDAANPYRGQAGRDHNGA